jgi:hypothetical protein
MKRILARRVVAFVINVITRDENTPVKNKRDVVRLVVLPASNREVSITLSVCAS